MGQNPLELLYFIMILNTISMPYKARPTTKVGNGIEDKKGKLWTHPNKEFKKNNYLKKYTSFYKERKIIQIFVKNMQLGWKVRMLLKVEKKRSKSNLWCEQKTHEIPITNFDMF